MRRTVAYGFAALVSLASVQTGFAADPESCKTIRMSDPGWTDITSTNAMLGVVLDALGYEQDIQSLAVPVTYESLKNGDVDAFLGNWMPAQTPFVEPLINSGDLVVLGPNLDGIRFTLAVPTYVADQGVKDFKDLAPNADKFDHKIYGIEPGAPANQNIQKMIDTNDFNLGDWTLVDSSEQGMLSQVDRAGRRQEWIVFLAWEPHPMNTNIDLTYLSGGDAYFGPNYGSATVRTVTRKGYPEACPNVARLLKQLSFSVDMENRIMGKILEGGDAKEAAKDELKSQPDLLAKWLDGVTTLSGEEGLAAVKASLGI
jgi:glycine betaine/proline transport system substrate-binding protein